MSKLRIAFDMDGVIVDLLPKWLELYNIIWDDNLEVDDIKSWRVKEFVKPEAKDVLENMLKLPNFYLDLKPIDGSIEMINHIIENMSDNIEVLIVTNPFVRESIGQKIDWIKKYIPNFPLENLMFVANKSLADADVLIDDSYENIENFVNNSINKFGIIYHMPYNKEKELKSNMAIATNWDDIYRFLT